MKTIFTFIVLVLTFNHAFAGGEVGNGGNVVVCSDSSGNVKSVEVLDYYELRLNGGVLALNSNLNTYQEKLLELFNKWRDVAPKRMEQYTKWLNEFQAEAGIYSGIEIPHIPDTGSIAIPQGCKPISIAFQRADGEVFPGTKRYVINKDLWDFMNETQKAGLVLHELIYREAIKAGHSTSLPTRYFNGYLSSANPGNGEEYAYIVAKLPLLWIEYGRGVILNIGGIVENGCEVGGNCQINFYRRTTISENGKVVKGYASELVGDFNLNGWNIKFIEDEVYGNGKFEFNQITEEMYIVLPFYEISSKDKFHFQALKNEKFNYLSKRDGQINLNQSQSEKIRMENSWFLDNDGTMISDIVLMEASGDFIKTKNGESWEWVGGNYIRNQVFVLLNKEKVECSRKEYDYFVCPNLPAKINCNLEFFNGNKTEYIRESLNIASTVVEIKDGRMAPGVVHSTYKIHLAKGQIVKYVKKFGSKKAIKLKMDNYLPVNMREICILNSY